MIKRQAILNLIRSHRYRPMRTRRMARFFDVDEDDYSEFHALVRQLIQQGEVEVGPAGRLVPPEARRPEAKREPDMVEGRFSKATAGFGFVIPDETETTGGEDVFIPPRKTKGAVTGDVVLARVTETTDKGPAGTIIEIVQRGRTRFVGTVQKTKSGPVVRPDGGLLNQDFPVPDLSATGAKVKDKVVFEVLDFGDDRKPGEAVIAEVLGERGEPGVDTLSVIRQYELSDEFPPEVLEEARSAPGKMGQALEGRRDLSEELVVTIDPDEARDFDDAFSLTKHDDGGWTLGVHIADVATFVPPGSALDLEAYERGTSVYLPTTVLPMLPEILSNGVCSLQEGRMRLTKSVFIRFDANGEPRETELANTSILSTKRMTYEQASAILEGKAGGLGREVIDLVTEAEKLARKLLERRRRLGYLELDLPEVALEFNDDGRVVDAHPEDTSFSHKIIEMFMVEANVAVAKKLAEAEVPFIRRIHPPPDAEGTEQVQHFAKSIGYTLNNPDDRSELQKLIETVRGRPEAYGIHMAVLRSLSKAVYSPEEMGHFALGAEHYCHFTSPIRRYPDLTVHRLVDALVKGEIGKGKKAPKPKEGQVGVEDLGRHCSVTERRAESAERELTKVKLLEFLQEKVGSTYTGVITGVQKFGLFVEIPHLLVDGLVHISSLEDDYYDFDKKRWALIGRRKNRVLRVGTELEVRIANVDIPKRQLDLVPVTAGEKKGKKKAEKKGEKKGKKSTGRGKGKGKGRKKRRR